MCREKSEKDVRNVPITVRLNEEEHPKLKQCATACGLSAAEFMLPFSAGVWQQGFEFQSRYIALRIRAGEISPVIRGVV